MKKIEKRLEIVEEKVKVIEKKLEKGSLSGGSYVKCNKCGYSWVTRSKLDTISCSNCGNKVRR